MCPGCTTASSSKRVQQRRDRRQQRPGVAARAGRCARSSPGRARRRRAGRRALLVGGREGHVAGAVAGREEDVDLAARRARAARRPASGHVGVVGLERAEAGPGHVAHDVGQDRRLDRRAVDGRAGRPRDRARRRRRGRSACASGGSRRGRRRASAIAVEQAVGLLAGVDEHRAVVAVAAHEVGVLGQRADGEQRTSTSVPAGALGGALLRALAPAVEREVGEVAERDVEEQDEAAERDRLGTGRLKTRLTRTTKMTAAIAARVIDALPRRRLVHPGQALLAGLLLGRRAGRAALVGLARAPRRSRRRSRGASCGACASSGPRRSA